MYELMINEFGGDIGRTIALMDYLADLGINCIEVMPVSNVANAVDWGFLPIGFFGVDERFGKRKDFQIFIDSAHERNIAVILDSVYGHTSDSFILVYRSCYHENLLGPQRTTWRALILTAPLPVIFLLVNHHWLDCYRGWILKLCSELLGWPPGYGLCQSTYEYQTVKSNGRGNRHQQPC
jgi:1,4-alpha-glucan branching enzyme